MTSVKEKSTTNPVDALQDYGQSVWLDFLARGFTAKGELKRLIDRDGLRGVTSNPSIFEKAIAHSDEYDSDIADMVHAHDRTVSEIYERLAVKDIKAAADVLRPVFDSTNGNDGFVSIEVSPYLAMDTQASIAEAKRLWGEVDRKNLMVKIPATGPGLPAIRSLIAEGINVNITLLFSQQVYEQVVEAYLGGLEALAAKGGKLSGVASVASFFVSRIDTAVDKLLDGKIKEANDPDEKRRLEKLKGKVAIANAKLAYVRYLRLFAGGRWTALHAKGARPQRLLWASTGTVPATTQPSLPMSHAMNATPPACRSCACRCATGGASRPVSASGRAFCIPPARLTKAARTAASFFRPPRNQPKIFQFPDSGSASALSKRRRRAATSACSPSVAGAHCVCTSKAAQNTAFPL
jgi:transaldolase